MSDGHDPLRGWTEGGLPNRSGRYAVVDALYACPRFAHWNQRDRRWSWEGRLFEPSAVSHHRPAPALPDSVRERWQDPDF